MTERVNYLLKLDVRLLELLEDLVLGDEGSVLVHDLLHLVLGPVLDRPVLELGLRQHQEGDDAALVLQILELDRPHHGPRAEVLQPALDAFKLLPGHRVNIAMKVEKPVLNSRT